MTVQVRPATPEDLLPCARVFLRSHHDLSDRLRRPRENVPAKTVARSLRHLLETDPDGFYVAADRGRVVCFAATILRGDWQFVANFWGLPESQGNGIGREVLKMAFEGPRVPLRTVRCVYASLDPPAQRLYMESGMVPRTLVYMLRGSAVRVNPPPQTVALRQLGRPGEFTDEARALAAQIDRRLRGGTRDADHRYLLGNDKGRRFYAATRDGESVGYVEIGSNGRIGPGGVVDPSLSAGLVWSALGKARRLGLEDVSVMVPAPSEGALRVCLAAGLRMEFPGAWMASREIGDLRCYFPASAALF